MPSQLSDGDWLAHKPIEVDHDTAIPSVETSPQFGTQTSDSSFAPTISIGNGSTQHQRDSTCPSSIMRLSPVSAGGYRSGVTQHAVHKDEKGATPITLRDLTVTTIGDPADDEDEVAIALQKLGGKSPHRKPSRFPTGSAIPTKSPLDAAMIEACQNSGRGDLKFGVSSEQQREQQFVPPGHRLVSTDRMSVKRRAFSDFLN